MSTTSRRRRWVGGALLAPSLVPIALFAWAWTGDRGLVWTHRLDRPLLALCALAGATWLPIGWLLGPPPTVATLESRQGALDPC